MENWGMRRMPYLAVTINAVEPPLLRTAKQPTLASSAMQVEVNERKDRVTDALNATKAAVDEGIVAGGGAALLHASRSLKNIKDSMDNLDQRVGVDIVARAVQMPARTILKNAGYEGAIVVGKLLDSDDPNFGFDSAKGQYCNMVDAGAAFIILLQLCLVIDVPPYNL
jgi:chaperonin GroEL (HSP60 family)